MLNKDPSKRISAEKALKHKYFAFNTPNLQNSLYNTEMRSTKLLSNNFLTEDERFYKLDPNNTTTQHPLRVNNQDTSSGQKLKLKKDMSLYTEKTDKSEIINTARSNEPQLPT